jgi:hypothetical protein
VCVCVCVYLIDLQVARLNDVFGKRGGGNKGFRMVC